MNQIQDEIIQVEIVLKVVCSYCKKSMGEKKCIGDPEINGHISHAICDECLEIEMSKLD